MSDAAPVLMMIPDLAAVAACAAAAAIDVRRYRIPNWLTVPALVAGLILNGALFGLGGLAGAALGAAVGLVGVGVLGAAGVVGMGDVKLVAAAGALIRWPLVLPALLYTALAGGVVAIALLAGGRTEREMPYGLAIAAGFTWAVASRYWPGLALL